MAKRPGAFCALLLCAALLAALAGCGAAPASSLASSAPAEAAGQDAFPLTFTDDAGRTVTLDKAPRRAAVLFSSYAQLWTAAGGTLAVTVGDAVARGYAAEGTPLVDDGAGMKIDLEALVAAGPDFVIASADMAAQAEACGQLAEMGIPAAAFREESVADYVRLCRLFCALTGETDALDEALAVESQCGQIAARARRAAGDTPPKVLFIRAGSGYSATRAKTAKDHFVGRMLEELGAQNIADDAGALSEGLALESVLERQPDVILIVPQGDEAATRSYMDGVLAEPGWRDLAAVQAGRCHYLSKELFHYKPNERWAEAYEVLAGLLYPEAGL